MSDLLFYSSLILLVAAYRWLDKSTYYGTAAALFAVRTVMEFVTGDVWSYVPGAVATVYFAVQWWRNRRNGRWKKAAKQLGAKTRARVASLVENMTRSPIPSPVGGGS